MKKRFLVIVVIILTISLLTGCDELFDVNTITERNPFIPTHGTPIPEPNAPLLKTPVPTVFDPTPAPELEPTETPQPITSTNPKPAPTTQPPATSIPNATPTTEPIAEPTTQPTPEPTLIPPVEYIPKLGILTDSSNNQTTALSNMALESFVSITSKYSYESVHLSVPAMDVATILAHIEKLVSSECEVILLPGPDFSSALDAAQTLYRETLFILLDYDGIYGSNVITTIFSEFQAGFLAGTAAAIELSAKLEQTSLEFGIMVEEDTVSAQLYISGFTEGLLYATNTYGIDAQLTQQSIIYLQFAGDPEEAFYAAIGLYDSGVECILNLAGSAASQVILAAIDASSWPIPAYVVGIGYDSFSEGLLPSGESVVITSAMTFYDVAVTNLISDYASGDFPGGTQILFDYDSSGVGLPSNNPGFSADTIEAMTYIFEQMDLNWLNVPPLGDAPITILAPPPIPAPIPTILPIPSETPTIPPLPSTTPTIPPLP